jgi:membrane-bound ClpP family serine protease
METPQIRAIRRYLAKYEINQIDLRAELVDHFASAVAYIQKQQPHLSFKEALMQPHRRFGGRKALDKYLRNAENKVNKKVGVAIGQVALSFLSWPSVLLLFISFGVSFLAFKLLTPDAVFIGLMALFAGQAVLLYYKWKNSPYFLVKRAVMTYGMYIYFLVYLPLSNLLLFASDLGPLQIGVSTVSIFLWLVIFKVPQKLHEKAQQMYAHD